MSCFRALCEFVLRIYSYGEAFFRGTRLAFQVTKLQHIQPTACIWQASTHARTHVRAHTHTHMLFRCSTSLRSHQKSFTCIRWQFHAGTSPDTLPTQLHVLQPRFIHAAFAQTYTGCPDHDATKKNLGVKVAPPHPKMIPLTPHPGAAWKLEQLLGLGRGGLATRPRGVAASGRGVLVGRGVLSRLSGFTKASSGIHKGMRRKLKGES